MVLHKSQKEKLKISCHMSLSVPTEWDGNVSFFVSQLLIQMTW